MTEAEQFSALTSRAIGLARSFIGVRETSQNRGPLIDVWLARIGLSPPQPWCLAFALGGCYLAAWRQLVDDVYEPDRTPIGEFPLPITGKVARFWRKTDERFKSVEPRPGAIFCCALNPETPESPGHCGIVVEADSERLIAIEGNSEYGGGREGDSVVLRPRGRASVNLGYVSLVSA